MQFLVPFDGSPLSKSALQRAERMATAADADLLVVTVLPKDQAYAEEKGWLDAGEQLDGEAVSDHVEGMVREIAPSATFRCVGVNKYVKPGGIATHIKDIAKDVEADVVFLGSENVGRIAAPVGSIGSNVASRVPYDIYLVQTPKES